MFNLESDLEKERLLRENARLKELYDLDIVHEEPELALEEIVRKTARIFNVPICVISLVLEDRQWFKAFVGLPPELADCRQTAREISFCTHVVDSKRPLVVTDVALDERFRANALVTRHGFRFYAGVPLITRNNQAIGTLCVYDRKPGQFYQEDIKLLELFAKQVAAQLQLRRDLREARRDRERYRYLSIVDTFLDIYNRQFLMEIIEAEGRRSRRFNRPFSVLLIDIDRFKQINDGFGHLTGDRVLREIVQVIKASVREVDLIGRFGGDELAVAMPEADLDVACKVAERLRHAVAGHKFHENSERLPVTISIGIATARDPSTEDLLRRVDAALYQAKARGRNQVVAL